MESSTWSSNRSNEARCIPKASWENRSDCSGRNAIIESGQWSILVSAKTSFMLPSEMVSPSFTGMTFPAIRSWK